MLIACKFFFYFILLVRRAKLWWLLIALCPHWLEICSGTSFTRFLVCVIDWVMAYNSMHMFFRPTAWKRRNIDIYCLRQQCSPWILVFNGINFFVDKLIRRLFWRTVSNQNRFVPVKPHVIDHSCLLSLQCISIACHEERCTIYSKSVCLSVRLSVCLTHVGTVSKWLIPQSCGLHCRIALWL